MSIKCVASKDKPQKKKKKKKKKRKKKRHINYVTKLENWSNVRGTSYGSLGAHLERPFMVILTISIWNGGLRLTILNI